MGINDHEWLKNLGLVIGKAGGTVFTRRVEELLGRHGLLWDAVRPLLEVRKTLAFETPAERFDACVASTG